MAMMVTDAQKNAVEIYDKCLREDPKLANTLLLLAAMNDAGHSAYDVLQIMSGEDERHDANA